MYKDANIEDAVYFVTRNADKRQNPSPLHDTDHILVLCDERGTMLRMEFDLLNNSGPVTTIWRDSDKLYPGNLSREGGFLNGLHLGTELYKPSSRIDEPHGEVLKEEDKLTDYFCLNMYDNNRNAVATLQIKVVPEFIHRDITISHKGTTKKYKTKLAYHI